MRVEAMRTHILVPRDLIDEVDQLAGKRKRSAFVTEAVRDKLTRERQKQALLATAGILSVADYPEWSTPEKTSEWVHERRRADDAHTSEKLLGRSGT